MRRAAEAALALLAASAAVGAAGCYRERERLDIPELAIELADTVVAPRDTIRGVIRASDGSGLSFLRWLAIWALDPARQQLDTIGRRYDLDGRRSVEIGFDFAVDSLVPAGSVVEVQAFVRDNQDFPVERRDTIRVRARP
jgi:hypothetical protein